MSVQDYFADDYGAARAGFLAACESARLDPASHRHPERGPAGEELCTDSVWIGPPDAANLLVLVSGVHGVELFCGSGCQTGWLRQGGHRSLPADGAVLLIHAINCWGAAHLRRNTDGNVDLCRNFVDFEKPLPERPEYELLHPALCCPQRQGPRRRAADAELGAFLRERGMEAFIGALMGGQYRHPDGFSFGGRSPAWSNRVMGEILRERARRARRVVLVEYHSGLGPYAYGTAVTMHTGEALDRARRLFGHWVLAPNERGPDTPETFYRVHGHTTAGYERVLAGVEVTAIVLEYGTYPPKPSLEVLLDDHWLAHFGDVGSDEGRVIKERMLEFHHPRNEDWRQAIWDRSVQVIGQSLRAFS